MTEKILNLYLVIEQGVIEEFRAYSYEADGSDEEKISLLKTNAANDFHSSFKFDAPVSNAGKKMKYKQFSRLEKQGKQFLLFEEIFQKFQVPDSPLVCLTPVVDGKILSSN
ncbi:MAG: hypothetical protein WC209_04280 [Ignavibacteriaceae bacterium]|jgi:hypothetical protein